MILATLILLALVVLVSADSGESPDARSDDDDAARRQAGDRLSMRVAAPVFFAAALVGGCERASAPVELPQKPALTVELVSPALAEWPERIEASGRIVPWQESVVGAEVGELRLEEVFVNVGDVVAKGELLARFDRDAPMADLAMAEAAAAQAEALAARASDKAARARRLGSAGGLTPEEVLQSEAEEKTSAAQLASARAQLQLQRLRLQHAEVRAPDGGVISARSATVGAVSSVGSELFRLIRQRRLEWHAQVSADRLARIAPGQSATLRLVGQPTVAGIVRQTSPVLDSGTLNATVFVALSEPGMLRAGMFVSGEFVLRATRALHVPESALVFRDGFEYVMKVDDARLVHRTKVSTGRRSGQAVEILDGGLSVTDHVVRTGGSFLNEGDLVQIAATPTAGEGERSPDSSAATRVRR